MITEAYAGFQLAVKTALDDAMKKELSKDPNVFAAAENISVVGGEVATFVAALENPEAPRTG